MFLNELNSTEAMAFINLVSEFANIDDEFAKEEKELIRDYAHELGISEDNLVLKSLEEAINELKKSSNRTQSIVYFELVGLALVDGEYQEKEVDFLDNIAKEFNINRAKRIAIANYFFTFTEVYDFSVVEAENKIELLKDQAEAIIG